MNDGLPESKLSRLRAAAGAGDWYTALQIAARFPALGPQRGAILSAWGALQNPGMYRQLGKDCDALVAAGRAALAEKYKL